MTKGHQTCLIPPCQPLHTLDTHTHFRHVTSLSFQLQPHLWCNTPTLGLCKRTWTSRRPEHPEDWRRLSSHSVGWWRQTELFSFLSLEQRPGWTAALGPAGRTMRSDRTSTVITAARSVTKPRIWSDWLTVYYKWYVCTHTLCSHYYCMLTAVSQTHQRERNCWQQRCADEEQSHYSSARGLMILAWVHSHSCICV